MATRHGPYSIEELARALFTLSGRTQEALVSPDGAHPATAETEVARVIR